MRTCPFALAAVLLAATALPSRAAEKSRPAQNIQDQPKKVWTNDDLDQLHWRGLISIVGQEPAESAATQPAPALSVPAFPVYSSRLEDPSWYAEKAADLQTELDKREAALREQQTALALATDGITQAGVALDKPSVGVTPEAGIAVLEAKVQQVQSQLDELSDLARRNSIPPGVLRG
ncbi:MAG TPA: hypothetical protein VNI36_06810 [Candidatus Dormibacteraeota bacterium]|nr:hypothetical protein [Candidatus Dormibacteraeota bacterium]